MAGRASYHVVVERLNRKLEYWDRWVTFEEAVAECKEFVRSGTARAVHLMTSRRGSFRSPGERWLMTWRGTDEMDVATRYAVEQAKYGSVPEPEPGEDLGEEEF